MNLNRLLKLFSILFLLRQAFAALEEHAVVCDPLEGNHERRKQMITINETDLSETLH